MLPAGVASRPPRAAGSGTRVTVVDRVRLPGLDNIFGAQRRGQLGARHGLSSTAGQQWGQQLWGAPMPSSSGGSSSGGGGVSWQCPRAAHIRMNTCKNLEGAAAQAKSPSGLQGSRDSIQVQCVCSVESGVGLAYRM